MLKKTEVANDVTTIRNDYATNASVDCKINDLKAQHIADEVKKVDDKAKKNARDILRFESRLKQEEDMVNENERGISFTRGLFFYIDQSYLVYCNLLQEKYLRGSQQVFLIIWVILI